MDFKENNQSEPNQSPTQAPPTVEQVNPPANDSFGQQFNPNLSNHNPYPDTVKTDSRPTTPVPESNANQEVKPPSQIKLWHWIALTLIIIGFVIVGWWYFSKKNPKPAITPPPATNEATEIVEESEEPLLIPLDTDGDGLMDDEEIILGTDLANQDTDGDGYLDKEEIDNGYNPLGAGLLVLDENGQVVVNPEDQENPEPEVNPELPINPEPEINPIIPTSTPAIEPVYSFATPEDTIDTFAAAINNDDVNLYVSTLSPNNIQYNEVIADPEGFLYLTQYLFDFKEVRIEIVDTIEEEYPDTVTVNNKIYLDGELFQDGVNRLEKINNEWKILQ